MDIYLLIPFISVNIMLICIIVSARNKQMTEPNQDPHKRRFEYKIISPSPNSAAERLNELGAEGWELVLFIPAQYDFVLKRELATA